jgi:hypothetical protein
VKQPIHSPDGGIFSTVGLYLQLLLQCRLRGESRGKTPTGSFGCASIVPLVNSTQFTSVHYYM